jgi:hypothetical protein
MIGRAGPTTPKGILMRFIPFMMAIMIVIPARNLAAQSAQMLSIQASGLLTKLDGETFSDLGFGTGFGAEFQLRINPSAFSLGAGFQVTSHSTGVIGFNDRLTVTGFFLEPRYAIRIRSRIVRPYLAGRLGYLTQHITLQGSGSEQDLKASASGGAFGGGGGLVARLSRRMNFDLGLALTTANFGRYKVSGASVNQDAGKGSTFVLKAGINLGLSK